MLYWSDYCSSSEGSYVRLSLVNLHASNVDQFSAPDLSDIAANLDMLERSYRGGGSENGNDSTNMDDTGEDLLETLCLWHLACHHHRVLFHSSHGERIESVGP